MPVILVTPPKSSIDPKNDCFSNASPFKYGYFALFWISMLVFRGCISYCKYYTPHDPGEFAKA